MVGVLGVVLALSVILLIYAHRKDRGALRERIILGLTIFSAIYSAVCAVPLHATSPDCTNTISEQAGAWFRVAWFATKCTPPPTTHHLDPPKEQNTTPRSVLGADSGAVVARVNFC